MQLESDAPRYVGTYRVLSLLGIGGMGRVYLGESPGGRLVAIKVMRPEHTIDPEFLMRFKREVAAARLVGGYHTAQVIDADPEAEAPWMVTAYIAGPPLHTRIDEEGPLSPEELRRLAAGLAEGLTAIHAAGLVHRDLKPGNVLMADDGPRIIDFGLARPTGPDATSMTLTGKLLGTLAFMSPEQVNGDVAGPESDVFSLGGVLIYAASGRTPFGSASLGATSYAIQYQEPDFGPVSEPMRDIVRSCLAKNPRDRPTPAELLSTLAALSRPLPAPQGHAAPPDEEPRFAIGSPVGVTYPDDPKPAVKGAWDEEVKGAWDADNFLPRGDLAAAVAERARRENAALEEAMPPGDAEPADAGPAGGAGPAEGAGWRDDPVPVIDLPEQSATSLETSSGPESGPRQPPAWMRLPRFAATRGLADRILRPYRTVPRQPTASAAPESTATLGAAGALGTRGAPGGTLGGTLRSPLPRRTRRGLAPEERPAGAVQVRPAADGWTLLTGDPGGRWIASADADGAIAIWDSDSGIPTRSWPTGHGIRALAGGPGNLLAVVGDDGVIHLWDAEYGTERASFACGRGRIDTLTFVPGNTGAVPGNTGAPGHGPARSTSSAGPDGIRLTTGGTDGIQLWDIPASAPPVLTAEFQCGFRVTSIAYGSSDAILAAGSANGRVQAWDLTLAKRDLWPTPVEAPVDGRYTHSGSVLALGWDNAADRWISVGADGPGGRFRAASVLGSGSSLTAAADEDTGRIRVFPSGKPERGQYLRGMDTPMRGVGTLWSRDVILMTGPAGVMHFWDRPRRRMRRPEVSRATAVALAVSPDESMIAVSDDHHRIGVFDIADGSFTRRWWRQCEGIVTAIRFTPDGKRLATAGDSVRGWNAGNGSELRPLRGGPGPTRTLAYDQSGRRLAAAGEDGSIPLWEGQRLRRTLSGHQGPVLAVAFGPVGGELDGFLITAGSDNTIRTWDAGTGQETRCLTGLGYQVRTMAASERFVAVGGADGGVRLYSPADLLTADPLTAGRDDVPVLRGHVHAITSLSFTGTGQQLVTGGRDGTAWCWDLATRQPLLVLAPRADGWAAAEVRPDGTWQGYGETNGWIWSANGLTPKPL